MRSGAQTLALLASPLNCLILRALAEESKPQGELRRLAGSPAQTTLRAQLRRLVEIDAISKRRRNRFPGMLEFELTAIGRELLFVADVLEGWLAEAPDGPLSPDDSGAKIAVKALVEAWSTTMLRALAAGPRTLTELDRVIGPLSYPALERRLGAMRSAHQIEARPGNGRGTPYAVTDWLRQGMGPLAAAVRWERRHLPQETAPITRIDTEAGFLLALPLLRLSDEQSGSCRMAMEIQNGGGGLAGVLVQVREGRVVSCATRLQGSPDAWASGPASAWLAALIEADKDGLELGGDGQLARSLLDGLHEALLGDGVGRRQ